jgi:hypothetical protein
MNDHVDHFSNVLEFNSTKIIKHSEGLLELLEKLKLQNFEKIT